MAVIVGNLFKMAVEMWLASILAFALIAVGSTAVFDKNKSAVILSTGVVFLFVKAPVGLLALFAFKLLFIFLEG